MRPILQTLIPAFLERRQADVAALIAALDTGDYDTVATIGHRMRGNGQSLGFAQISSIGTTLETAGPRQDRATIREQIEALEHYLERVDVVFD